MTRITQYFSNNEKVGSFGINYLDDKLKGILKGDLILIGARSGCVDKDTEYFNGKGWRKISEYNGEQVLQWDIETQKASLCTPIRYIKKHCNKFYHFNGKYAPDMMLSEEHKVLYVSDRDNYMECTAEELYQKMTTNKRGFSQRIPMSFDYSGKGIDLSDEEIRLMLAVIADGYFVGTTNRCYFHFKKERKIQEIRNICKQGGFDLHEYNRKDGYTDMRVYAPRIEKVFTPYWYDCNRHQLQLICDNVLFWDGCISNGRRRFSTTQKESADFIQFAFSSCGYKATIKKADRQGRIKIVNNKSYITKSIDYVVSITDRALVSYYGSKEPEVITGDMMKYCFEVPCHYLVLRRNGKIFITHNSGKSTLADIIAQANARDGFKVHWFSLENFQDDNFATKCFYYYRGLTNNYSLDLRSFASGNFDIDPDRLRQAEEMAEETYKNILITYRKNDYKLQNLKDDMVKTVKENGTKLIILDHLDYVDKDNPNENDNSHITELMSKIRELQDIYKVAVVAFSHLRKPVMAKDMPAIPSVDEFIGSSNKVKQATAVIVVAPDDVYNEEHINDQNKATWFCIRKLRMGGIDNKAAKLYFNRSSGAYQSGYEMYSVDYSGKKQERIL